MRARYLPGRAVFAAFGAVWVFVLVALGAFTTSISAGMAFPDWPLSNGSLNPHGWLTHLNMFAEHSHRLSASTMGLITIVMAIWIWRTDTRRWIRHLGLWAVGLVIFQGLLGGMRVLLDPVSVSGFRMTLGQMLRIPHGIVAQIYVCVLIALAAGCSRRWIELPRPTAAGTRRLGQWCVVLIFIQLTIAAVMRHNNAGLAIPTFPWSNASGGLLPKVWSFKVAIHFAHRVMALFVTAGVIAFALSLWRDRGASLAMRTGASFLVGLLALQILLGAYVVLSYRDPDVTTTHVLVGALTLATTFWLTFLAHRDAIEEAPPPPA